MKKIIFFFFLTFLFNFSGNAQNQKNNTVNKTNSEWKQLLTPEQYYVLRKAGTERPNSSPLNKNYKEGVYICAACKTPLYKSDSKFDSGCGWPSFDSAIKENIEFGVDYKLGYARTELRCKTCGGHLGHVFDDGPKETTGKRHCVNGVALEFIPKK
ncbi:peptide-methionine (R)-S-oxide reductase MsrB [Tenacibaculum caenipelagi]|uniref:peptide-methionine (R)-S-oxide reductase n=1 Tax=Tenacibaculum caenipelagi TaxID=1325435 RepID=A0A4R6TFA0_9FLAO|nr:peptide-methionine (R)-S-oxide reductase MsrB [Tenacibaculum caenipelagi]TDQ25742.1 peptide-methionine (R)-S-oxide reductase [Tenacibaculum caenipelagi]